MPEISVIIPNYNHASFLQERIGSVLNQTFQDFEVILMDDCSTDNSQEIIKSYKDHKKVSKIILNKTNSGSPFHQWQTGIQSTTGKWVWIAESDDYTANDFLEKMMLMVTKHNQVSIAYSDSIIENYAEREKISFSAIKNKKFNTHKWEHPYFIKGIDELNETLKWECTINNISAAIFNAQLAKAVAASLLPFKYHGDWLFYIMLATAGNITYTPEKLNTYREHGLNISHFQLPEQISRSEKFRILQYLLTINGITEPRKVFRYFLQQHVGYGILSGPAFGKKGYFKEYSRINSQLSRRILFGLLTERFKNKISI